MRASLRMLVNRLVVLLLVVLPTAAFAWTDCQEIKNTANPDTIPFARVPADQTLALFHPQGSQGPMLAREEKPKGASSEATLAAVLQTNPDGHR